MRYIYQNVVQDGRGNFVSGATVTVTLADGSTAASIYSTFTGGTVDDDGIITTGADGTFAFYVDEDDYSHSQQFRIVWSKSGFASETWDYIKIFPDGDRTLLTDSTVDQGDNSIVGTLAWHIADVTTTPTTITVLQGTYKISTNITAPETMVLEIKKGGIFKPDASRSLTVYSPEHILASPRQQIIDMTNNSTDPIAFTVGGIVYPDWLEVNTTPGTTDMAPATNALVTALGTTTGKVIRLLPGTYAWGTKIALNDNGFRLEGAGRGPGGRGGTTAYREAVTLVIWVGANTQPMIEIGKAASAICWGVEVRGMELDADETTGSTGINVLTQAAGVKILDVAISRTQVTGLYFNADAWKPYLENVGVYDYEGGGMDFRDGNHNAVLNACQIHFCDDTTPDYGIRFGEDGTSAGVLISGCDIEPENAPLFLHLKDVDAAIVTGCYFEARNVTAIDFIKIGETGSAVSVSANITGNTFQGANVLTNAITIEGPSDGVVVEGNHAWGMTTFINSQVANQFGVEQNNRVTTTTNLISTTNGVSEGWRSETYDDITADTGTSPILAITHYTRNPYRPRLITATIIFDLVEAAGDRVQGTFRIQRDTGGGFANLSDPVVAEVDAAGATDISHQGTVTIRVVDTSTIDSIDYRVTFALDVGDTLTVKNGCFINVRELDTHYTLP